MKIFEISNRARKIIKDMENIFIEYSTHGRVIDQERLWLLIEQNSKSPDLDIAKQSAIYKRKLHDSLIQVLREEFKSY